MARLEIKGAEIKIIQKNVTNRDALEMFFPDLRRIGGTDYQSRKTFDIVSFPKEWIDAKYGEE